MNPIPLPVAAVALLLVAITGGPLRPQGKDQKLPAPPRGETKPLPPVLEPARGPVERRDLRQKFQVPHGLEGVYRLRKMLVKGGAVVQGSRGYLFVGHRHLSMQLYAPSSSPDLANLQAVTRSLRVVGNQLVMSTLLGHRNQASGRIALDALGTSVQRRFELTGAVLRIYLSSSEYFEFERVE